MALRSGGRAWEGSSVRLTVIALLAGLVAALGHGDADAFLRRGDVVIAQDQGLVRLDPATGVMLPIPTVPMLRQPTGVVVLPDGDLVVADWDLPVRNAGSVVRVRVLDGAVTFLASGGPLNNPFAIARGPNGRIVLADIDAGTSLILLGTLLRRGALFDLDPVTGALERRVQDCCEWNPTAIAFTSPTELLVADAGCCAYSGVGNLATADLATGTWAVLPSPVTWRDPFGIALSSDGATAFIVEASVGQPGPPAVYRVDLTSGMTTTVIEGPPLGTPTGILLEDDDHLLIADEERFEVLRLDIATGAVTTVATGQPLTIPATLTRVDVGDVVSGVTPATDARATCSARAARQASQLVARVLRCAAGDIAARTSCLFAAIERWPVRRATAPGCTACIEDNRLRLAATLPDALVRTPGERFGCTGDDRGGRRRVARAAALLFKDRSRCAATHLQQGRDASRLQRCQDVAMATFVGRTTGRCDDASLQHIAQETASMADALIGAWYCAP